MCMRASCTHPRSVGLYVNDPAAILKSSGRLHISSLQASETTKPVPCTGNSKEVLAAERCRQHDILQAQSQPLQGCPPVQWRRGPSEGRAGACCRTSLLRQQLPHRFYATKIARRRFCLQRHTLHAVPDSSSLTSLTCTV